MTARHLGRGPLDPTLVQRLRDGQRPKVTVESVKVECVGCDACDKLKKNKEYTDKLRAWCSAQDQKIYGLQHDLRALEDSVNQLRFVLFIAMVLFALSIALRLVE